jgi:hypothetical protein
MKKRMIFGCLCFFCVSALSLMAQADWVSVPAAAFTHGQYQYPYALWFDTYGWGVEMASDAWGLLVAPVYFSNADGKYVKNMVARVEDTSTTSKVIVTLYRVNEWNGTCTAVFSVSSGDAETYTGRASLSDWSGTARLINNTGYSWFISAHFSGSPFEEAKVKLFSVSIKYE